MEQEVAASSPIDASVIAAKGVKVTFLALVWIPFLGSTYLTVTHLLAWLKTGFWPSYSTANLFSDLAIPQARSAWHGVQSSLDWVMAEPAAYSLMAMAIILSITMTLVVKD